VSQQERITEIKQLLETKHELKTGYLVKHFKVSNDTVRRDILKLVQTGQAIRIYGGIAALNLTGVPEYLTRTHILSTIKIAMAKLAAQLINSPGLYFLGTSTTLVQMGQYIDQNGVTITTNSIDNVVSFIQNRKLKVEIIGGTVDNLNRYTYSMTALSEIRNLTFKKVFIGASGITAQGAFVINENDANLIRKVIQQSQQVILIAENYKFGNQASPYKLCDCQDVDILITDKSLTKSAEKWFKPKLKILRV
jgi:DeoR/GlpR family transcriptional regulator of sugar metabolism